jgi:uncharacterized protein YdaU (DUF1376 family)
MKLDAYMPFYGNDFFAAVEGLDEPVIIGYLRAVWYYWSHTHCRGLPDDDEFLRRLCRTSIADWQRTKGVIFGGFFTLETVVNADNNTVSNTEQLSSLWHQNRARCEYKAASEVYNAKVQAVGKARKHIGSTVDNVDTKTVSNIDNNTVRAYDSDSDSDSDSNSSSDFWEKLRPLYPGVNLDGERRKMTAWLMTPKGKHRRLTQRFAVNWLNRCEGTITAATIETDAQRKIRLQAEYDVRAAERSRL